jgi:hypothetical protein
MEIASTISCFVQKYYLKTGYFKNLTNTGALKNDHFLDKPPQNPVKPHLFKYQDDIYDIIYKHNVQDFD